MSDDFSSHFTTDEEWDDRQSMIEWVRSVGKELNILIVIQKSWDRKVILSCEKSGSYRPVKKKSVEVCEPTTNPNRSTRTKKSDCPFQMHGLLSKESK